MRDRHAEAAALEPLLVQIRLGQLRDELKRERDTMPEGSVGAKRLSDEISKVNDASMIVGRHA